MIGVRVSEEEAEALDRLRAPLALTRAAYVRAFGMPTFDEEEADAPCGAPCHRFDAACERGENHAGPHAARVDGVLLRWRST